MTLADQDPPENYRRLIRFKRAPLVLGPAYAHASDESSASYGGAGEAPEGPDDIIHRFDISSHPLGQKISVQSSTPALILLAIAAFFSIWVWQRYPGYELWSASAASVFQKGEYWRLLTTLFVHADIAHLLANSGLFLVFGTLLRQYFGTWAFPILSLLGGVLTTALALLTYEPEMRLIGASGMVYLMAAVWLLLFWRYADYLTWMQRSMRSLAFILVVLAPSQIEPQVSYRTHAIGLVLGFFLAWLSGPWLKPIPVTPPRAAQADEPLGLS